jgi:hypothetical protein
MSEPAYTLDEVIAYYAGLLALQYADKPKAVATMNILVKQAVADYMAQQLATCFTLGVAVGPQLDIIAKYVGVSRNSQIPANSDFFGFALVAGGGSSNGYNSVIAAGLNGFVFDSVNWSGLPTINFTDLQFAFVLPLQIAINHFDGTLNWIQNYLAEFFPGVITVRDNLNMSITYTIEPNQYPISFDNLVNYLPAPMGVQAFYQAA